MNKLPQDFRDQFRSLPIAVNNGEEVTHIVELVLLLGKFRF